MHANVTIIVELYLRVQGQNNKFVLHPNITDLKY